MTRWTLMFLALATGCVAALPTDQTITADLACEAARMVATLRQGMPPTPVPPQPGKCQNCNGTGKIGDGRIVISCSECGGDGVVP